MAANVVRISIDGELLRKIDTDRETRRHGRSAFVRSAVERCLAAKDRCRIDEQLEAAYAGKADGMLAEIADLLPS